MTPQNLHLVVVNELTYLNAPLISCISVHHFSTLFRCAHVNHCLMEKQRAKCNTVEEGEWMVRLNDIRTYEKDRTRGHQDATVDQ